MQLYFQKRAIKGLRAMPVRYRKKLLVALEEIAEGRCDGKDVRKLQGREGFRYRLGRYRAIFRYDEDAGQLVLMVVTEVGPRGGVYK